MRLREIFPENRKMTHPTIKDKKVTYYNTSIKLWKRIKYTIELISVKNYKKGLEFLMAKTLKDVANDFLKLAKVFSRRPVPFKANALFYPNASQYPATINACKKICLPKHYNIAN